MSDGPGREFSFFRQYALCGYALEVRAPTPAQTALRSGPAIILTLPPEFAFTLDRFAPDEYDVSAQ